MNKEVTGMQKYMIMVFAIFACAVALLFAFKILYTVNKDSEVKAAQEAGYTFYIDGVKADSTHLDLGQYNATVDDQTKEVYLTQK